MIKWIKTFLLGIFLWIILTVIYGFLVSILQFIGTYFLDFELPSIFIKSNYSNFNNFILLPVGMWASFKFTKTSFLGTTNNDIPITKLQIDALINELKIVVKNANELNKKDRERVATNVMNQMAFYVSEIEGLPKPSKKVDEICKRQLREAMIKRQNAITVLEYKNPDWIEASLVESFLQSNSGFIEKKTHEIMIDLISGFIRKNT
jgi:hypothetical protein